MDDDTNFKVKGEVENYLDSTENKEDTDQFKFEIKLLIKAQSCVRRFLQVSKFLKQNRNIKTVINLKSTLIYNLKLLLNNILLIN